MGISLLLNKEEIKHDQEPDSTEINLLLPTLQQGRTRPNSVGIALAGPPKMGPLWVRIRFPPAASPRTLGPLSDGRTKLPWPAKQLSYKELFWDLNPSEIGKQRRVRSRLAPPAASPLRTDFSRGGSRTAEEDQLARQV
jgi:hypothetical protein